MNERLNRLRTHCLELCTEVIWPEIAPEGCILVRNNRRQVIGDDVTTHHLVDLLHVLNGQLFLNSISRACRWFCDERADLSNPFFITTLAQAGVFQEKDKKSVADAILSHRRKSGLIEIYTAFLDSGSLFATLWAVKILLLLQEGKEYQDIVSSGLKAVRQQWDDLHRISFRGFYLEMVLFSGIQELQVDNESICKEIIGLQSKECLWDMSEFYSSYVAGNLLSCVEGNVCPEEALSACDRFLDGYFGLSKETKGIPKKIKHLAQSSSESVYLQTIIRSVINGIRRLRLASHDITSDIAGSLLGTWPTLYYTTGSLNARLKRMEQQYNEIEKQFQKQNGLAQILLKNNPYERNVFVIMPFKQHEDEHYGDIERIIRDELEKKGFHAWLATDRELDSGVWENVTTYMTGCKYGIAVFTRLDNPDKGTIKLKEFNPNISLEIGFMASRAKRLLLLKDKPLPKLPTDLVGKLYREFDLRKVNKQLSTIIKTWADELLESEREAEENDRKLEASDE